MLVAFSSFVFCQQSSEAATEPAGSATQPLPTKNGRILGLIPNNRTWPSLKDYKPLSTREKFEIARQDSFDRGTVVLAAVFAADGQLTNSNPSFGQGVKGYTHRFGTAYGDFIIGNYLSEAIYPTLLHQDPRYFRRGAGSGWSRLGYSIGQVLWTSHRLRPHPIELLGASWQFDGRRNFDRVLSGQPERHRCSIQIRLADRRRYGVERPQGVLA